MREEEGAAQVHVDGVREVSWRDVQEGFADADAGVVDEDVDVGAEGCDGCVDDFLGC